MTDTFALARMFSLTGKHAVITGASRGIGHALANGLADAGASVTAIARSAAPDTPLRDGVCYLSADVTEDVTLLFEKIASDTGGAIDVLVNAAGVTLPGGAGPTALENFAQTLRANLTAPFGCCIAARPFMPRGASIINVTSIGSVLGFPGNPGYVAAKGGLRMMTRALAVDFGAAGIRVNALAPGYIRTAMTAGSFADPTENARRRQHTCLDRWGNVEDLVGAAVFLASEASAYMTGQDLFIDGGWTAKGMV